MPAKRSRSLPVLADEELRLPRPPGVIRQFWARHPLFADVLIALSCLVLSLAPATTFTSGQVGAGMAVTSSPVTWAPLPLIVIAACALLLRRRQWPITAFVASFVVAATYLIIPVPVGGPLLLVTSYSLAVYRSTRACWAGLAIGTGALTALAITLAGSGVISMQIALNAILGELVLGLFGALIGINVGNRKRYLAAVIDRSRQLLVERDQHARLAASAERARIAREMHDIVSHSLTVIVALSEGAAATSDRDRARDATDAAAATARAALAEMRSMLGVLRSDTTDTPLAPTEPVAPETTVTAAQRAGYPVTLTVSGDPAVPQPVRYAIGRIVQEGVTNAMRHAPNATATTVRIAYSDTSVSIDVHNDGAGLGDGAGAAAGDRAGTDGFGIRGLIERAAHVGGSVTAGPNGDGCWTLHAQLPIAREAREEREESVPVPAAGVAREGSA